MTIREFNPKDINNGLLDVLKETWFITEISDETLIEWQLSNNYMFVAEIDGTIIGTLTLDVKNRMGLVLNTFIL